MTIDSAPPASWSVPYFDFTFHASDAVATFECALGSGAFAACTSPFTLTVPTYGVYTLSVRASDALGNVGSTTTASWFFGDGPVIVVQYDSSSAAGGGDLAEIPGYEPAARVATAGGRKGLAARSPSYRYVGSKRAVSSGPDNKMFASLWIRPLANASGVIG